MHAAPRNCPVGAALDATSGPVRVRARAHTVRLWARDLAGPAVITVAFVLGGWLLYQLAKG
ncbi:hypothetical protein [Streptomyces sulfonofaciens]|nr:hypothetical protein [Streptomyces sulfonofaciens]